VTRYPSFCSAALRTRSLHLTRFGGHLILAEGRRKESRHGTSVEIPG
jgi:hypothetical protein